MQNKKMKKIKRHTAKLKELETKNKQVFCFSTPKETTNFADIYFKYLNKRRNYNSHIWRCTRCGNKLGMNEIACNTCNYQQHSELQKLMNVWVDEEVDWQPKNHKGENIMKVTEIDYIKIDDDKIKITAIRNVASLKEIEDKFGSEVRSRYIKDKPKYFRPTPLDFEENNYPSDGTPNKMIYIFPIPEKILSDSVLIKKLSDPLLSRRPIWITTEDIISKEMFGYIISQMKEAAIRLIRIRKLVKSSDTVKKIKAKAKEANPPKPKPRTVKI